MPTPEFADKYSDVVFQAVAHPQVTGEPSMTTRLQVIKVYRGVVPSWINVAHGGMKGYTSFEVGKVYLVFGLVTGDAKDTVFVHLCGATHQQPATGRFAEGPWRGWSVTKAFGRARKATSSTLRSGQRGSGASASASAQATSSAATSAPQPSAPQPSAPQPSASDAVPPTEPAPQPATPSAAPVPLASPPTVPVTKPTSGCGGCAVVVSRPQDGGAWLLVLGLAAAWRARRRRS